MSSPGPPLHLRRSSDGADPAWPTTVRLAASAEALEVRFECRDELAWGTYAERDAPLWREEVVEVFLAPIEPASAAELLAPPKEYVEIEVSPLGALFDARVSNPDGDRATMRVDTAWDWPGIEWRAGRLGERQDWWAELVLPWRGLDLGLDSASAPRFLRANFYRVERPSGAPGPDDEFTAWSPTRVEPPDFHRPDRFGLLVAGSALEDVRVRDLVAAFRESGNPLCVMKDI